MVRFAIEDLDLEIDDLLSGPTAIAFVGKKPDGSEGDPVSVAKALKDFAKNNEALALAIKEAIELFYKDKAEWNKRKKRSTQHILDKYKLNQMVNNFNKVWASVHQEIN